MARQMVAGDLSQGRLVELRTGRWAGKGSLPRLEIIVARRSNHRLGPAGRWLFSRLTNDG
jgi:hypothetical protein